MKRLPIWLRLLSVSLVVAVAASIFAATNTEKSAPIDCDTVSVEVIISDSFARRCLDYMPKRLTKNGAAAKLETEVIRGKPVLLNKVPHRGGPLTS